MYYIMVYCPGTKVAGQIDDPSMMMSPQSVSQQQQQSALNPNQSYRMKAPSSNAAAGLAQPSQQQVPVLQYSLLCRDANT